jgi:zinc transporter ZupT
MKTAIFTASGVFVAAVLLAVVQLWFTAWKPDIFLKIELTLGAAFLVVVVVCVVIREYNEDKTNRSGKHLN